MTWKLYSCERKTKERKKGGGRVVEEVKPNKTNWKILRPSFFGMCSNKFGMCLNYMLLMSDINDKMTTNTDSVSR